MQEQVGGPPRHHQGGAYLNNAKVESEDAAPAADDLLHGRFLVLRRGKRNVGGIEVTASS